MEVEARDEQRKVTLKVVWPVVLATVSPVAGWRVTRPCTGASHYDSSEAHTIGYTDGLL
jgi:hypothetical protein